MRRFFLLTAIAASFAAIAGPAFGTLFKWRDRVRPPVSLKEALNIGERLLGDDAKNRFCVDVSIYGNPIGAPKPGAWNLLFAAEDGSKKHVYVDMEGNGTLSTWNEAIDWKKDAGRRKDLNDAQSRLESLFEKENLEVTLTREHGRLVGHYRTRSYAIYKPDQLGAFAEELTTEVGPKIDGFMFDAEIVDDGTDHYHFDYGPYWTEYTQLYPTTEKGKLILVRKRLGRQIKQEMQMQIDQAFGIDFVNP